ELRNEFDREQQIIKDDLAREKTAHGEDVEEAKKLRSDLAGVQARLRAMTDAD
ncbi:MAG: hypothetical protein HRU15_13700, partial [Planctomycetes bacterium]|nr:hypothetical protein [Planctomycetota bacterium]